eukprot:3906673-Pleurochrysis_carterae.AAC.1
MAPRSTRVRTKSPPHRRRPRKAASQSQTQGPQQQLDSVSRARQPSNYCGENVAASAASEPAQHAGSMQTPIVDGCRAPQSDGNLRSACVDSVGIARSSSMTRRGFRARPGSSETTPEQIAEDLGIVSMDLGRTRAELTKANIEVEHYKEQARKAMNNYGY